MISQPDLFTDPSYPDVPGVRNTDTSREAGAAVDADTLRGECVQALRDIGPLTADECAEYLGADKLAIRPRFSELRRLGKVEDSGKRRRNTSGKMAIVWELNSQRKDNQ